MMSKEAAKDLTKNVPQNDPYADLLVKPGEVLSDKFGKEWMFGELIGRGGFGQVYLASDKSNNDAGYVVKVENITSRALCEEISCLSNIGSKYKINKWKAAKKLEHLGIPQYVSYGTNLLSGIRFLVLPRYEQDMLSIFIRNNRSFCLKTVVDVSIVVLDVLEYIHTHGYVHRDIKAANILCSLQRNSNSLYHLYLTDYGLVSKFSYREGGHKPYLVPDRKIHVGTAMFCGLDSHMGITSRRSDLESLAYNMIYWLTAKLPWMKYNSSELVFAQKETLYENLDLTLTIYLKENSRVLYKFMSYIKTLAYNSRPDYTYCRRILKEALHKYGYSPSGLVDFKSETEHEQETKQAKQKIPHKPAILKRRTPHVADKNEKIQRNNCENVQKKVGWGRKILNPIINKYDSFKKSCKNTNEIRPIQIFKKPLISEHNTEKNENCKEEPKKEIRRRRHSEENNSFLNNLSPKNKTSKSDSNNV